MQAGPMSEVIRIMDVRNRGAVRLVVTSAAGANGNGYGTLLAFDPAGQALGAFSTDRRIADPRGLAVDPASHLLYLNSGSNRVLALDKDGIVVRDTGPIEALNPGGGVFGPDGRLYVGLRSARTLLALPAGLNSVGERVLPPRIVPFPRGFGFGRDGRLFLASGIGPNGEGENTIVAFTPSGAIQHSWQVSDPDLSPLDLTIAPGGNIVVSSEHPFGAPDAVTSVREYDPAAGHLLCVLSAGDVAAFRKPRGLRFGPDGNFYCAAQDEVVKFDLTTGMCLGATVRFPRLNGQAIAFFP
jgi:DNA-binding beta-propeller fold protein YncE